MGTKELERRVAALERRLAQIESMLARQRAGPVHPHLP